MEKHSQNTTTGQSEQANQTRIRAAFCNMEQTCACLSGQAETARETLAAVEMEHLADATHLWPLLLKNRKQLGMALLIALKDCQCLGGAAALLAEREQEPSGSAELPAIPVGRKRGRPRKQGAAPAGGKGRLRGGMFTPALEGDGTEKVA